MGKADREETFGVRPPRERLVLRERLSMCAVRTADQQGSRVAFALELHPIFNRDNVSLRKSANQSIRTPPPRRVGCAYCCGAGQA